MTDWHLHAACRDSDPSTFYPDPPAGHNYDYSAAVAVCAGCPVRGACLEAGLGDKHGVWGGLVPSERAVLARKRADTLACSGCGVVLPVPSGRGRPQRAWCADESCQRECVRQRTEAWRRRRGVAS